MTIAPVFVSTGGFKLAPLDAVHRLRHEGVTRVELSGGVFTDEPLAGLVAEVTHGSMQIHNYFPPPQVPFVFNLSDPDPSGRAHSIKFARDAIDFGLTLGSTVYSFHAGFLGTPTVSDLGRTWGVTQRISLDEGTALFAKSVADLSAFATERGVKLLVENNVLTVGTAKQNGDDILLMTTPEGMRDVFGTLPPAVGLLMDVAHLAVSARTLGFDPGHALAGVADLVGGYHLSENDGTVDSNQPVRQDSWFWDGLTPKAAFVTLEINPDSGTNFADQVLLAEAMLDRNSG
jgi:hypothetical protein